jgi:hypothetical protein
MLVGHEKILTQRQDEAGRRHPPAPLRQAQGYGVARETGEQPWNIGLMECWNSGRMEDWNEVRMGEKKSRPASPFDMLRASRFTKGGRPVATMEEGDMGKAREDQGT